MKSIVHFRTLTLGISLWMIASLSFGAQPVTQPNTQPRQLNSQAAPQSTAQSACSMPVPTFVTGEPNIFNERQEQDLGDALAEYEEADLKLASQPAGSDELTRIGEKLFAVLPPTQIHYRFRIYDSGEVNGFSLAGGRVYISRKLIAAVKNEDELAGVLAHELGHISTHQTAIELTRALRFRLGVSQVGDRADIFAKVHQFFGTAPKPGEDKDREKADQLVADRVALYAMVRAGYAPESFASFLDQIMVNKGKTGNWLSDAFGITHEESRRYRSALKLISALPQGCKGSKPGNDATFANWLHNVVEERPTVSAAAIAGDRPLKLDPPLRPSLWRIRFSQDGRYVLAQDESSISVVDRNAGTVQLTVDAPDANGAEFTPDSQNLVFSDGQLRVERWSLASGKRTSVSEMVVYSGCRQSLLSPDGETLVCANLDFHEDKPRVGLQLIDVETGKPFFDKPGFFEPNSIASPFATFFLALESLTQAPIASIETSPDGRYLLVVVAGQKMAYDLDHRRQVELGGRLKELTQTRMAFLGTDQLMVVGESKGKGLYKASELSFPDGRLIKETELGDGSIDSVTKGRFLKVSPLKDYAVGILDPDRLQFKVASKSPAMDIWDPFVAAEGLKGGLDINQLGSSETKKIPIAISPLPHLGVAEFSQDGKYLAVSLKQRAAIWNLETGKQVALTRPMQSVWIDGEDRLFAQLPKFQDREPTSLELAIPTLHANEPVKYEGEATQIRNMELSFKPMGKDKAFSHHITLEVRTMQTQTVAWSRNYPHESPACWTAEDDRLVLAWDLSTDSARAEIKNFPALQSEAASLKKRGLLLETVVLETGAPLEQVIVPEADFTRGWKDERRATVSGDFVLVRGEHGNTGIYSIKNGAKVAEFFGSVMAEDARSGLVAAINRQDEIIVVDEHTGKELERFTLGSPVRLVRIVGGNDGKLLVLTADQVVHRLPLPS